MIHNQIAIIGMSGCLKTTVGKFLATNLGYNFVDTDQYIQQGVGDTISNIFRDFGQDKFRQLELDAIGELCNRSNIVLSTGGGTICQSDCMRLLGSFEIVWLKASLAIMHQRLLYDNTRPLLLGNKLEKLKTLYEQRQALYARYSNIAIDNSHLTAEVTAQKIYEQLVQAI